MIQETLVTTSNLAGIPHIAPMGIEVDGDQIVIMPFKPSTTLDNILATGSAVINYSDDVRVFAGCLTGRRDWPLLAAEQINGHYLADTLAHSELRLQRIEDDPLRPKLFCDTLHSVNHQAFRGFNRAQFAVLEAAILVSRLDRLSWDKIEAELAYLQIGIDKTAGDHEREAWGWLMDAIEQHKQQRGLA